VTFLILKELNMSMQWKVFPSVKTKEFVLIFHICASVLKEAKEKRFCQQSTYYLHRYKIVQQ